MGNIAIIGTAFIHFIPVRNCTYTLARQNIQQGMLEKNWQRASVGATRIKKTGFPRVVKSPEIHLLILQALKKSGIRTRVLIKS